jgi:hypothetical protein
MDLFENGKCLFTRALPAHQIFLPLKVQKRENQQYFLSFFPSLNQYFPHIPYVASKKLVLNGIQTRGLVFQVSIAVNCAI